MKYFLVLAHQGENIPPELKDRIQIEEEALSEIGERESLQLVDWDGIEKVSTDMHQCFPNLNRARNNIDPATSKKYPLKRELFQKEDFQGKPIYIPGKELTQEEEETLLKKYYDPFYEAISEHVQSGSYDFFIDFHAMNNTSSGYDSLPNRPDICLGNRGDQNGEQEFHRFGITFPSEILVRIKGAFRECGYDCQLNYPFSGGYIIQEYGIRRNFPSFQIEINKRLFMTSDSGEIIPEKANILSQNLSEIFSQISL